MSEYIYPPSRRSSKENHQYQKERRKAEARKTIEMYEEARLFGISLSQLRSR